MSQFKLTADNFYNLGVSQLVLARYSEAIASLDHCLKLNDKFKFAYYARTCVSYQLGDRFSAMKDFQQGTKLEFGNRDSNHQNDEHGYYVRGLAKYRLDENKAQAIKDLETAKKIAIQHQYKVLAEKAIALLNEINQ